MNSEEKKGIFEPEIEENTQVKLPFQVILYNDDWHSFEEVISQLIKAVKCSYNKARDHAFETHVRGKSMVFSGELSKCISVSSVLEEIALHTQITS